MNTHIYRNFGAVSIDNKVYISDGCQFGLPKEARIVAGLKEGLSNEHINNMCQETIIQADCILGSDAVIYEGTIIHKGVIFEDRIRVGYGCSIGEQSRLMYGAYVCDRVTVGVNCRIAGFICDAVQIGNNSTVMGNLVHAYTVPDENWGVEESAPIIGNNCVIGYGAIVIGGVSIGNNSYVGAGAIITKDVPSDTIVIGQNEQIQINNWRGFRLKKMYEKRFHK